MSVKHETGCWALYGGACTCQTAASMPYPPPSRKGSKPFWGELLKESCFCVGAEFMIQGRRVRIVSRNHGWAEAEGTDAGVEFRYADGATRVRTFEVFRKLVEPVAGHEYAYYTALRVAEKQQLRSDSAKIANGRVKSVICAPTTRTVLVELTDVPTEAEAESLRAYLLNWRP